MKVLIAGSLASRLKGLTGCEGFDGVIALVPCHDVHTFTMTRPIDVAFVSAEGLVLESYQAVPPLKRLRHRGAVMVLERYSRSDDWLCKGDELELALVVPGNERED